MIIHTQPPAAEGIERSRKSRHQTTHTSKHIRVMLPSPGLLYLVGLSYVVVVHSQTWRAAPEREEQSSSHEHATTFSTVIYLITYTVVRRGIAGHRRTQHHFDGGRAVDCVIWGSNILVFLTGITIRTSGKFIQDLCDSHIDSQILIDVRRGAAGHKLIQHHFSRGRAAFRRH